ncbi:hypothetical protein [Marinobacter profundi]|uniref:Uncharacterized protein n=1 Tax=Marinobacter profundi TaxID=2666256 RepID=A0A2G1UKX6_9GAMM|nr:hypothetical protein [Marinobacter profundi]PHQ15123.1 hypothetical protein CLH61_08230 [Marinobacter profundi]
METKQLQTQIKSLLAKLKWSQKKLARVVYTETNEFDDDEEIGRFEESLKKDLTRPTTKPERLLEYLKILSRQSECRTLDILVPVHVGSENLSSVMQDGMKDISKLAGQLAHEEENL